MMAVRRNLYHPDEIRQKIKTSAILRRLNDYVFGRVEMTATQATVAVALLRKTIPDLSAVAHSGHVDLSPEEMTDDNLVHIATAGSAGAIEAPLCQKELGELH